MLNKRFVHVVFGCLVGTVLSACGTSRNDGEKGLASFQVRNCGGVLSDLQGCPLSAKFASGGKMDVTATRKSDESLLMLRTDLPAVLKIEETTVRSYVLTGLHVGEAKLIAHNEAGEVDRVSVFVEEVQEIAYNEISSAAGTFKLQPSGDLDGTLVLRDGLNSFNLYFAQLDGSREKMLGREAFSFVSDPGLTFQAGQEKPSSLEFHYLRPKAGTYTLQVNAKAGPGRFKLQITAN
ncbi:MAG TPA: hypothetical protein PKE31_14025 [Pseudomonadota bacterium]|nr:hypothetical protein [Pseudomonadota bacterium]